MSLIDNGNMSICEPVTIVIGGYPFVPRAQPQRRGCSKVGMGDVWEGLRRSLRLGKDI